MKIKVTRKIGGTTYTFVIEEDKDLDVLEQAGVFGNPPTECGMCGSTDIHLASNRAKSDDGTEYKFVKLICDECSARSQLGQYKTGGFYWKDWEKYEPTSKKKGADKQSPPPEYQ